jgi:hypothetical protein
MKLSGFAVSGSSVASPCRSGSFGSRPYWASWIIRCILRTPWWKAGIWRICGQVNQRVVAAGDSVLSRGKDVRKRRFCSLTSAIWPIASSVLLPCWAAPQLTELIVRGRRGSKKSTPPSTAHPAHDANPWLSHPCSVPGRSPHSRGLAPALRSNSPISNFSAPSDTSTAELASRRSDNKRHHAIQYMVSVRYDFSSLGASVRRGSNPVGPCLSVLVRFSIFR